MITLTENAKHQLTIVGTGMIAEARTGHVDVTGWRLLDAPEVEAHEDGSFTLRIAVPEAEPKGKRTRRVDITAGSDTEAVFKEVEDAPAE